MITINQLKLPTDYTKEQLIHKIAREIGVDKSRIVRYEIMRRSIDARKKPDIFYVLSVSVVCSGEDQLRRCCKSQKVSFINPQHYTFEVQGTGRLPHRPVIVGSGPAGLFCAYQLAKHGYRPLVLERGEDVDRRMLSVQRFWDGGRLDPESNVQFGEGGAGTFSDGKLNTLNKDPSGRNREVLRIFVKMGAKESILYDQKPHLGTDALVNIVKNLRNELTGMGGEIRFDSKVTGLHVDRGGRILAVTVNGQETIPADVLVLAIGHSARDTFRMLHQLPVPMEAKDFAVGYRIIHPQEMINESQYGTRDVARLHLGAAPYKLTAQTGRGRGVYSFCMCPGGYVVNASSQQGRLCVNGMSYSDRDSGAANSAIIMTVRKSDFGQGDILSGMHFQQKIEETAFKIGQGKIPLQLYQDFKNGTISSGFGECQPAVKGDYCFADVHSILPQELNECFLLGMEQFGRRIKGFDRGDAIVCGIEARTSSPLRILRDKVTLQSSIQGLYPCGEGAGYAGGITSAAADGLCVAEAIAREYAPLE